MKEGGSLPDLKKQERRLVSEEQATEETRRSTESDRRSPTALSDEDNALYRTEAEA